MESFVGNSVRHDTVVGKFGGGVSAVS